MIAFFEWMTTPPLELSLCPGFSLVMHVSLKKCNIFHKILYKWNQIPVFIAGPSLQMFLFKAIFNRNSKV